MSEIDDLKSLLEDLSGKVEANTEAVKLGQHDISEMQDQIDELKADVENPYF